jgi:putative hydrolase of the HAD superfamily
MEIMKNVKAVIFDLDDTLYPEIDYVISGFKCVAKYLSKLLRINNEEILKNLIDLFTDNKANVFNRYLTQQNYYNNELLSNCIEIYRQHYPKIKLYPEAEEILQWLRNEGYKIGIITDGRPEGQRNKIKALELEKYCDEIMITDEIGGLEFRKPNVKPYQLIIEKLKVIPEQAIYIGDNPSKDFLAANKLGMITIMLKNEKGFYQETKNPVEYSAQITVENLIDIKNYLKGIVSWGDKE